jgi:hypothetical protein
VAQPALPPADREFYTLLEEELQAHAWPANEALAAAAKEAMEHNYSAAGALRNRVRAGRVGPGLGPPRN